MKNAYLLGMHIPAAMFGRHPQAASRRYVADRNGADILQIAISLEGRGDRTYACHACHIHLGTSAMVSSLRLLAVEAFARSFGRANLLAGSTRASRDELAANSLSVAANHTQRLLIVREFSSDSDDEAQYWGAAPGCLGMRAEDPLRRCSREHEESVWRAQT